MFHEGQQLGEYTLVRKLGQGGFGEVWLAEGAPEKYFALKFPYKEQVDWKSITQEIGVWTLCGKHPNVLPLMGARNFDGQIAIISEYAPGGSLEDLLKQKGKLSTEEAVRMANGILQGLEHLHRSGIVHSDLKPANILLDNGVPRLSDFGISRVSKHTNTMSQTIAGTLKYMAPECFDGKRNIQTDVWAVGVILYQMLTGTFPYTEEETVQFIAAVVLKEPQPLPDSVPPVLKNIIFTALAKESGKRFPSAEQMRQNLLAAAQSLNIQDVESRAATAESFNPPPTFVQQAVQTAGITQQTVETKKPKKSRNWLLGFGVSAIVLLLFLSIGGAGVYYYLTKNIFIKPTPTPFHEPPLPTASPSDREFYEEPGKIDEILDRIEKLAGGKLNIVRLGMHHDYSDFFWVVAQDPNNTENYDQYNYVNGNIQKRPEKGNNYASYQILSRSEINWGTVLNLVKIAREKSKDLEGAENVHVMIDKPTPKKELRIYISVPGARKDFRLYANANGEIEKTEIK